MGCWFTCRVVCIVSFCEDILCVPRGHFVISQKTEVSPEVGGDMRLHLDCHTTATSNSSVAEASRGALLFFGEEKSAQQTQPA